MADETTDTVKPETATTEEPASEPEAAAQTDAGSLLGDAKPGTGDGEAKPEAAAPAPDAVVPEAYDLKLVSKAEDGTETLDELDPVLVEAATPLLKEAGLTNEQANKLLPLVPQVQEQLLKQQTDKFAQMRADWAKQVQDDPDIGGSKMDETKTLAAKALDRFTGPDDGKNEFRKFLNESGLGNHPAMVKAFREIGKAIGEDDTFVRNTTETATVKSREEKLYPNDVPKVTS